MYVFSEWKPVSVKKSFSFQCEVSTPLLPVKKLVVALILTSQKWLEMDTSCNPVFCLENIICFLKEGTKMSIKGNR